MGRLIDNLRGKTTSVSARLDSNASMTGSDIQIKPQYNREKFQYLHNAGIYRDVSNPEELSQLRNDIRMYSIYNSTLSIIVNMCAMFVSKGARISCNDSDNAKTLNDVFDDKSLNQFIYDFVKEYLITGEATSVAFWDDDSNTFTEESLIDSDQITFTTAQFITDDKINIDIGNDELAKSLANNAVRMRQPTLPYIDDSLLSDRTSSDYPDTEDNENALKYLAGIYDPDKGNLTVNTNDDCILRITNRIRPWQDIGYPVFAPALPALSQQDSLDAALYEQLNTLITPTIIGTVGLAAGQLGPNTPAWIPSQADLNKIRDTYAEMFKADFRLGLFTIGIHFESAFSNANIPDLSKYYDRCLTEILRCVCAGKGLLDGSSAGPFSGNAINRDVFTAYLSSVRDKITSVYQKRIDVAIKNLELTKKIKNPETGQTEDLLTDEGNRIYEDASLVFDDNVMKSNNEMLDTLIKLAGQGVPVSKQTMVDATTTGLDIESEVFTVSREQKLADNQDVDESVTDKSTEPDRELKSALDNRND